MGSNNVPVTQFGGALLVSVAMLLTLTAMVSYFSLRQNSFLNTMNVNAQNLVLAQSNTQLGLEKAMSQLQSPPVFFENTLEEDIKTDDQHLGNVSVKLTRQFTQRFSQRMELVELVAVGIGSDQDAESVVTQHVIKYPLVRAFPPAPVFINGSLVVNVDLSLAFQNSFKSWQNSTFIWLTEHLDGEEQIIICSAEQYAIDDCDNNDIAFTHKNPVINPASKTLPYIFNIKKENWPYLQDEFAQVVQSCEKLNLPLKATSLWVIGDCWLDDTTEIGSSKHPALMVIQNGDLHLRGQNSLYGLIVLISTSELIKTYKVISTGNNKIVGGFIANTDIQFDGESLDILFAEDNYTRLMSQPFMWKVARVPGSWRDFE